MTKYETSQKKAPLPIREPAIFPIHKGKRFIVTGGAGGLGLAIVGLLLNQGASVCLVDLKPEAVDAAVAGFGGAKANCFGLAMDVGNETDVQMSLGAAVDALGGLDGLVNCAALVLHADPLGISRADWQRQFEVNLFGAYELSRLVALHMIDQGTRGAVVNIASEAGKKGHIDSIAYSASKAALISLTRTLSEALGPHDINVNCVCPGGMATPMLKEVARAYSAITQDEPDDIYEMMKSGVLGRHTEPREVARIVSFLLSDDAMMIRGQAINADAGDTPY